MEFEIEIPAQFFGLNGFTMKFNSFIVKGPCPLLSLSTQYHEFMISVAKYFMFQIQIKPVLQWWKWKQRRNWFCLFLKNPCYDSKIMHVEFWLEVSKVLHLSINPVSWLFTMPELFLPEKAENSLNVKDYFFAKNDCRNIWKYSFASDMIELWLVIE